MNEESVDQDRKGIRRLTQLAITAFVGAFVLTIAMLTWSYFASESTSDRLAQAGSFAAGGAAAWAFVVAIIALLISVRSEEGHRERDRAEARLLQAKEVESQYDLQLAIKAIDSVVAVKRVQFALERVMEAISLEIPQTIARQPIAPEGRHQTWYAMTRFVEAVQSAESVGALETMKSERVIFTNVVAVTKLTHSVDPDNSVARQQLTPPPLVRDVLNEGQIGEGLQELTLSPASAILELAADAERSIETQDVELGMRWLPLPKLLSTGFPLEPHMVFAAENQPSSRIYGKAEWAIEWLENADVDYILAAWEDSMGRSEAMQA